MEKSRFWRTVLLILIVLLAVAGIAAGLFIGFTVYPNRFENINPSLYRRDRCLFQREMSMNRFLRKVTLPDWIAVIVLLALLALGLSIYSQYGLSWDEPNQLTLGIQNYRFALNSDPSIFTNHDRWYGPFFEIFLIAAQSRGSLDQIYLSRHLLNFLSFFIGCIAFFLLARKFTRNGWLALLGLICLVLSPRIFADAFYNSKDIPFLTAYTICLFSLLWFLDKPNLEGQPCMVFLPPRCLPSGCLG